MRNIILGGFSYKDNDSVRSRKMNNYEKIKSMSIEEMAEWFAGNIQCRNCFVLACPDDRECDEVFKQ